MYVGYVSLMRYNEIALKYVEMATYHFLYLSFFCQVEPFKLEKETREFFHLKEMPSQVPPEPNLSESATVEVMGSENKENRDIEANTIFLTENEKKTSSQNGRKKEGKSRKKESEKARKRGNWLQHKTRKLRERSRIFLKWKRRAKRKKWKKMVGRRRSERRNRIVPRTSWSMSELGRESTLDLRIFLFFPLKRRASAKMMLETRRKITCMKEYPRSM